MKLSPEEQAMLMGEYGKATQKAMEILTALGTIYEAEEMLPESACPIRALMFIGSI